MKYIVTGASGFVGRELVPVLSHAGHDLLLVGRERDKLMREFPTHRICTYAELEKLATGCDAVIHLAARNNDQLGSERDFEIANVELALDVAKTAVASGVPHFVHFSSLHVLDAAKLQTSPYARTKRLAEDALNELDGIRVTHLRCGAVHGQHTAGNLALADKFPRPARRPVFALLSALKPTTSIASIVKAVDALEGTNEHHVIVTDDMGQNAVYQAVSAVLSWSFALVVLLFFGWLLLVLAILVRLTSRGPSLFVQERVGKNRMIFKNLKFRTMATGTKQAGTHEVSASAVTKVGRHLRRFKLDELPQIFNIMRGDLALVGPRPCLPTQETLVAERDKREIYSIKPGITGLAQIRGVDMSDPHLLAQVDQEYLKTRSILLDIKLVIATILGRGSGDRTATVTTD